jgi:hypothetical protein
MFASHKQKSPSREREGESIAMKNKNVRIEIKLLFLFFVTFLEFINSTGGIHQNFLAGKEGMRGIGNLQFDQGIFIPIFPFNRFLGRRCGPAEETITITHIFKNDEPVICRMNALFHNSLIFTTLPVLLVKQVH